MFNRLILPVTVTSGLIFTGVLLIIVFPGLYATGFILAGMLLLPVLFVAVSRYVRQANLEMSAVIIPEFSLPEQLRFYELGLLLDGEFSMQDLFAVMVYYALFPPSVPDEIEAEILASLSPHTLNTLYRMHIDLHQTEEEQLNNIPQKLAGRIKGPVINKLFTLKYFNYNPVSLRLGGVVLAAAGLAVSVLLMAVSTNLFLGAGGFVSVLIISLGLGIAAFSYSFFESADKTTALKQKARGYMMFLKTVEWYRVEKDEQTFAKAMPYFILFGLKTEHFEKMLDFAQRKIQIQ